MGVLACIRALHVERVIECVAAGQRSAVVAHPEPLHHVKPVAVHAESRPVQVVKHARHEPDGVDHQRVALPPADGMTGDARLDVSGVFRLVQVDRPDYIQVAVLQDDPALLLVDVVRLPFEYPVVNDVRRLAPQGRTVEVANASFSEPGALRGRLDHGRVQRRLGRYPRSPQVGTAVGEPGRTRPCGVLGDKAARNLLRRGTPVVLGEFRAVLEDDRPDVADILLTPSRGTVDGQVLARDQGLGRPAAPPEPAGGRHLAAPVGHRSAVAGYIQVDIDVRIDELELGDHRVGEENVLPQVEIPPDGMVGERVRRGHGQENRSKRGRSGCSSFQSHLHGN